MADLSKIKLNGTEYDLKDAVAREHMVSPETDTNVTNMLAAFGLDTTTQLQSGTAGTSSAGASSVI